jgi:hypothetical protein
VAGVDELRSFIDLVAKRAAQAASGLRKLHGVDLAFQWSRYAGSRSSRETEGGE